jgi:DNA-binding response OmpR family regulator
MPEVLSPLNHSALLPTSEIAADAKILVIDDEAGIRESLEVLLTLEGYSVEMAIDGEAGLALLERNSYDLVLLDLALPGQSGMDLLPKIHECTRICQWS